MRILLAFGRAYPARTLMMLLSLLLAGVAEGVGLSTVLPLVSVALKETSDSGFANHVVAVLDAVGLEPTVGTLLAVIVIGMGLSNLMILLANRQAGYAVAQVATDLRLQLIEALLKSRWEYYLRQPAGALANAVASDSFRAATSYEHATNVLALASQAGVYAVIALLVSWQAGVASLLIGALLLFALRRLVGSSRRAGKKQTLLMRELLAHLTDVLGSVKPLKAMARQGVSASLLRRQNARLNRAMQREVLSREALRALQEPMLAILAAAGLYQALVIWQLPLASVMVITFLLLRVLSLLQKAQQRYHRMAGAESGYWALQDMIAEAQRQAEPASGGIEPSLQREIRFEQVGFDYGGRAVLQGLDLSLPAGSFTSLVGPSGAGKTTVLDLLCALLTPQSGRILIDDVPLETLDRHRWRRLIGYVPQETLLLHDSILANVTLGDPALSAADAERALRQAGAWEFIEPLPEGMQTVVGERGGRFSGGQRQRLVIARALANAPRLLILDEATSALDPQTEAAISATLKALTPELTVIAVSHRPALIEVADRIYRLKDGRLELVRDAAAGTAPAQHS